MSGAPVLELRGLRHAFGQRVVLAGLDLAVAPGEFVVLLGRSGAGKSTLLRLLAGLQPAPPGTLRLPPQRAVVFQEPRLMPWKTVRANVLLGLRRADAQAAATAGLAEVGLQAHAEAWPASLSGGEAQRVALARALLRQPQLLLLDEPFAALDALTRLQMQALVLALWQRHRPAVVMVTHDIGEALQLADRVLLLEEGRIAHQTGVPAPHPRRRGDPALLALEEAWLARLGVGLPNPPPAGA